jgi:hypothetical protein
MAPYASTQRHEVEHVAPRTKSNKDTVKKRPLKRGEATEATIEEFERENMGIAPKE